MKLLVMGNNGHLGGLSVHYTTLVDYLAKQDIELFCIHINDKNEKIFNNGKIGEVVVPYQPKTIGDKIKKALRLYKAGRQAKKFAPDVFVAASLGYGFAMIASKLPSSTYKIFEEVHFEAERDRMRLKMLEEFDAVATQTLGMTIPFKANVSDEKPVYYLPCFSKEYDADGFKPIPPVEADIRLGYFGRLAWNKGIKEFIEWTSPVFKANKHIKLDIFGGGPEKENIQKAIDQYGFGDQIALKGFYSDEGFPDQIASYHGVILPSIATEGLPLILIEAMRFGRPVFTTTTGAMPEVGGINKEGMIVSEKDAAAMAQNFSTFIENLLNNKYDAGYINNIYEKNFSNKAFMEVWMQMLHDPKSYFVKN